MVTNKKEFGLIFWTHLLLIIVSYLSFLYIDWKIIVVGVLLLQVYYLWRGGCDLAYIQFGYDNKDITFVWYYLHKLFPNLSQKKTKIFIRYAVPICIVLLSFILQKIMGYVPLIRI